MIKAELAYVIAEKTGLKQDVVELVLSEFHNAIVRALKNGDIIKLQGFGTFSQKETKPKLGRNPKTGETIKIPSKKTTKFKMGKDLKTL